MDVKLASRAGTSSLLVDLVSNDSGDVTLVTKDGRVTTNRLLLFLRWFWQPSKRNFGILKGCVNWRVKKNIPKIVKITNLLSPFCNLLISWIVHNVWCFPFFAQLYLFAQLSPACPPCKSWIAQDVAMSRLLFFLPSELRHRSEWAETNKQIWNKQTIKKSMTLCIIRCGVPFHSLCNAETLDLCWT